MDSYDVIAGAVKDYWKANYPQDVVAFFQQKYSWDDKWERCEELVECHGGDNYENMTFLSDFCEGQTEVKDVIIIPFREVTVFYYKRKIENHESKPQTVRHGRWLMESKVAFYWMCSECGCYVFWEPHRYLLRPGDKMNYCPNCGAKMDGGGE